MAETKQKDPAGTDAGANEAAATNPADTSSTETSPELAPVMKVTRARATPSDVPSRSTRAKAAAGETADDAPPSPPAGEPLAATSTGRAGSQGRPADVSIYQGGADSVAGDNVTITQGGASTVEAQTVNIRQGGIANAQAEDITVSMGGVMLARADRVSVEMGGLGLAFAREAQVTQGVARSIFAQEIRVDQGLVGTALAGRVTFERPSGVFLLLAGRVEGQVKALMDWRGALAFGAAFGLLVGLLRRR